MSLDEITQVYDSTESTYKITILEPDVLKFLNVDRVFDEQTKDIIVSLLGYNMYRGKYQVEEKIRFFNNGFHVGKETTHIETNINF